MRRSWLWVVSIGLAACQPRAGTPTPDADRSPRATEHDPSGASRMAAADNVQNTGIPQAHVESPPATQAPPAPPPPPPYDLAADLGARKAKALEELGKSTVTRPVGSVFLLIGPTGWQGQAFAASVSLVDNALAGFNNGRFTTPPKEAISVYLFADAASYNAYCKKSSGEACMSVYGFYQPATRSMVMNAGLGLGTLTHELAHPFYESDFPDGPTWLNEGIASLYEAPVIPKRGEITGMKNWRLPRLVRGLAGEHDKATMTAMFGMPDAVFRGEGEDLHYATARYVCQWLDQQNKLWSFYHAFRDHKADDPSGEKAFADVIGKAPKDAAPAWERWVKSL